MGKPIIFDLGINSDLMHNRNCFSYLINLKPFINEHLIELLPDLIALQELSKYDEECAYGDLYSTVIASLENTIDSLDSLNIKAFDSLIYAIYHNNNLILEQNYSLLHHINWETSPLKIDVSNRIINYLSSKKAPRNKLTPEIARSVYYRLNSLLSPNFKPQHDTNIPSLKNFSYKTDLDPVEYRFSTQAQRHEGTIRISPLFKQWLDVHRNKSNSESPVDYVYFNNLGLDRSDLDTAGSAEKKLTLALHELEKDSTLNIAVITLPANQGLMSDSSYQNISDQLSYNIVFTELLNVANGKKHASGVSDFWISDNTKKKLFSEQNSSDVFSELLTKSFKKLGFSPENTLSTAQKQAVWLHFIKYELTHFILITLKPKGYNFSCKDAIDRGAVSSAYYNLMNSLELNKPITRKELELAIDSAATNTKARGMNFHRKIIWNALDTYINANYSELGKGINKSWLIYWRDMNCPHSRVSSLLKIRMKQSEDQFKLLPIEQNNLKKAGLNILKNIKILYEQQVNGQRLLLELVSRTSELLSTPSEDTIGLYKNLTEKLQLNHSPYLYIIGGLMKSLLGLILFVPTLGYSKSLINKGISTAKTGFFASQREQLCKEILDFPNICIS